ncbi:hypothetical protein AZH53_05990 [Methanomicrobiaceae archaeon CYW5]|uniref:YqhA family protein n=1 Tax=Methanovulcanius yangii TaxID=1789227 RepID=UPI0029C9BFF1|nr:YqhA family protein [Methanovulcanius yangii]MBT8507959.1 hypothetical protein [Methanovulcanius yangii]
MSENSPAGEVTKKRYWLKAMFVFSRFLVVIAIIGLMIGSVVTMIAGVGQLFRIGSFLLTEGILSGEAGTLLSVAVSEMIDLLLIGVVLIIIALGLYQLFIDPDLILPDWLNTTSLESLKGRLLIVILVVLPVTFLGYVTTAEDGIMVAGFGIGISLIMVAIGYVLSVVSRAGIERRKLEIHEAVKEE